MQTVLELSHIKARKYFLEPENYCNISLPKYVDFGGILNFVQSVVNTKDLNDILANKDKKPSSFEEVNYTILMKKDAMYSYRPIQLANPYLYYLLVKKMTTKVRWDEIKNRFKKFSVPQIEVISIPKIKGNNNKSHQAASVTHWWECVEQRSLELALRYRYMFITDITNCYPSLYTHSIAWAMMGKDNAKRKKGKSGQLGNEIDTYIQGMQYGQTNGIPQGSTLFDFIAEMVLCYADKILSLKLRRLKIDNYTILRYRDDYRIFSDSKTEVERIAFLLHEVLSGFNFHLNSKKTFLTEDLISDSIKPDKLGYVSNAPIYHKNSKKVLTMASSLQQEAIYIHQFAKKYPNSGSLVKLLTLFAKRMVRKFSNYDNKTVLISIITDIALGNPKTYKQSLMIISWLLGKYPTTEEREHIVNLIYDKFQRLPNIGEVQIWLQRITFNLPNPIEYSEKICKIVANKNNINLWNNDWVKSTYKIGFPEASICNNSIRNSLTPIIDIDEVSLFDEYLC